MIERVSAVAARSVAAAVPAAEAITEEGIKRQEQDQRRFVAMVMVRQPAGGRMRSVLPRNTRLMVRAVAGRAS